MTFLLGWILRSASLILAGALLLRVFRIAGPSLRLIAWTAILASSLTIPLLTALLPEVPLHLLHSTVSPAPLDTPIVTTAPAVSAMQFEPTPGPSPTKPFDWIQLATISYAIVAAGLLLRLLVGLGLSLCIRSRSALTEHRNVLESKEVESPVTAGLFRPAILLPADWRNWDSTRLRAVLAHERSHLRRRDPALQFLSAVHCALLWMNPAAWLLHRAIVRTGEEISDEDAITATPSRTAYVEILLHFMQRGAHSNPIGVAMARYDQPKKRILRILSATAGAPAPPASASPPSSP